jgi:hypothetical protein
MKIMKRIIGSSKITYSKTRNIFHEYEKFHLFPCEPQQNEGKDVEIMIFNFG